MKMPERIPEAFLALCGANCMVCYKHLTAKKPCPGCRMEEPGKPNHCRDCSIQSCAAEKGVTHCFSCFIFPCPRIHSLDRSYRKRYRVSLIQNGEEAHRRGISAFLEQERRAWACPHCGGVISLQDGWCSACGGSK